MFIANLSCSTWALEKEYYKGIMVWSSKGLIKALKEVLKSH